MGRLGETTVARYEPGGYGSNGNGGENGNGGSAAGGFTKLPHWFTDHALGKLTGDELKVVVVIMRETIGRGNEHAAVAKRTLAERTGIDPRYLRRIVKKLIDRHILVRDERLSTDGDAAASGYTVAGLREWESLPERPRPGPKKGSAQGKLLPPGGGNNYPHPQGKQLPPPPGEINTPTPCLGVGVIVSPTMSERRDSKNNNMQNSGEGLASLASLLPAVEGAGSMPGVAPPDPHAGGKPPDPHAAVGGDPQTPLQEESGKGDHAGGQRPPDPPEGGDGKDLGAANREFEALLVQWTTPREQGGFGLEREEAETSLLSLLSKWDATLIWPYVPEASRPGIDSGPAYIRAALKAGRPPKRAVKEAGRKGGSAASASVPKGEDAPRADDRGRYEESRRYREELKDGKPPDDGAMLAGWKKIREQMKTWPGVAAQQEEVERKIAALEAKGAEGGSA